MIKAICLDFFGVLCVDQNLRLTPNVPDIQGEVGQLKRQVNLGQIEWNEFVAGLARASDKTTSELEDIYEKLQLNKPLIYLLDTLRHEYKLALVTNASKQWIDHELSKAQITNWFSAVVASSEVGILKPDVGIYRVALKQLGIAASEAVMVDDQLRNIISAQQLGMQGIVYENFDQFSNELNRLLADSDN